MIARRDASIPSEGKTSADPAPEVGDPVIAEDEEEDAAIVDDEEGRGGAAPQLPALAIPPAAPNDADVNNIALSYFPAPDYESFALPELKEQLSPFKGKRKLFNAGFHYSPEERNEKRWKATHILGAGGNALVSLWVRTNESNTIESTMAVRDLAPVGRYWWTSAFYWRDCLPRELAT